MGDILNFSDAVKKKAMLRGEEYVNGECICMYCEHKWDGSYPEKQYLFDCPECFGHWGTWHCEDLPERNELGECGGCESPYFFVKDNHVCCLSCGSVVGGITSVKPESSPL